nr:MAG TPA: hypothetical protein [Caudoviricetes sp.]
MEIVDKLLKAGNYMKSYHDCKNDFKKIPYSILAKDICTDILMYIKQETTMHDLDFEMEFELCLCEITRIVYKWGKADGIFRKHRVRIQIKKLDLQMERLAEFYMKTLLMLI